MPPGDLVIDDYQYEWRGLLMGHSTNIIVERINGLMDLPGLRDQNIDLDNQEGEFLGPAIPRYRTITFDLTAEGTSPLHSEQMLHAFQQAFASPYEIPGVPITEEQFVFQRPGRGKMMIPCRTWRRDFELDFRIPHGLVGGSVGLRASQPRIYSLAEKTEQIQVADTQNSNNGVITNDGNYPTIPVVTLTGEWDNPVIANDAANNRQVRLNIASAAGDVIVIDFNERTVTQNGLDITESVQRPDTQWWPLMPGNNTITVTRDNANTLGTAEFKFRDAWV